MASFNSSSVVQGTIKNVHPKGFAFAVTSRGDVFIPNAVHEALGKPGRGSSVQLKVKQGDKGLVASVPAVATNVRWGNWQVGKGQLPIPNTIPCSSHSLTFACFKCGTSIVSDEDIHKIKEGTLWTNSLCDGTLSEGSSFYNKFKKVHGTTAHCRNCRLSLGTIYRDRYHEAEVEKPFPCVKLTITREHTDDDAVINQLVLRANSRGDAEMAVSRLVRDGSGSGGGDVLQMRTTKHTFDLIKQAEADRAVAEGALKAKAQAEAAAQKERLAREGAEKAACDATAAAAAATAAAAAAAAALECSASRQWSCEVDGGQFQAYGSRLNELIEAAYNPAAPQLSAPATWTERGFQYEIDWERSVQTNLQTRRERLIRATRVRGGGLKPWTTEGEKLPNGAVRHSISESELARDSSDTREQAEFNFAYAQMVRLGGNRNIKVHKVDVIECPAIEESYAVKKASMVSSKELWVFHGTRFVDPIVTQGFKVGGVDSGVSVANGKVYGNGVYTGTGPKTPMDYASGTMDSSGCKTVILAKALEGVRGSQERSDCWAPHGDWLVFKTGEQLLPKYVVYWS